MQLIEQHKLIDIWRIRNPILKRYTFRKKHFAGFLSLILQLRLFLTSVDYVHVCNTFLVSNNKNIFKVKETQDKKLCNLLLRNMGNNCDTCQDPDKVIFNFSSYNLSDHEKIVLCKGLSFAIPPKNIEYSEFLVPFEMLFRDINSLEVSNLNK